MIRAESHDAIIMMIIIIILSKYHSNTLPKIITKLMVVPHNLHILCSSLGRILLLFHIIPIQWFVHLICENQKKKYVWCIPHHTISKPSPHYSLPSQFFAKYLWYTLFVVRFLFCIKNSYKNIVTEVYYFTFTFKQHMWIYVWIEFWSYHWILRYLQNNCIAIEDLGDTYIFYIFKW